nr:DUF559 domain-containing protein [Rhizobium sp. Root483D2]
MVKKPSKLDRFKIANSRRLRNGATDAEIKLWRHLERIPIDGTHFRRQVPIGPYFADFACHQIGLIIELDGSQHASERDCGGMRKERLFWRMKAITSCASGMAMSSRSLMPSLTQFLPLCSNVKFC